MSPTKKEQSAATTTHLLDIARDMFAERGFAGVGLEDVAAQAEMTRGAVYHHFKSKNGLFAAVLDDVAASVASVVGDAADGQVDAWDQLVAGCHAFVDAACSDAHRRILLIDGPAVLGWATWRESDARHSGRLLREGLAELSGADDVTAVMLSGAMNEAALWLARDDAGARDRHDAHVVLDRLLESLRR
ncbi:TetR/AcrR family transcriptional regulator [Rhodococcoides kyotonense]|uniref:DNA-binding transcriptional regulator, AcrR family n=1 Tax=Rhodococcoides kyotonense TaxID=398843 RepID=A0A239M6A0_9NOCA|nr:TetR/AcrR family transcriptional regulator [Rhodococcus kyotonensis]SNT37574.1 DNA-binding transcriptional regulator, AcrR family [Rhodococcus kyotonensis]